MTAAENVVETIEHVSRYIRAQPNAKPELFAWYLHLPSGERVRIAKINVLEPFVRFTDLEGRLVLVAPDQVALTIAELPPDTEERRVPIGFAPAGEIA